MNWTQPCAYDAAQKRSFHFNARTRLRKLADLLGLWREGLSASQIARQLGGVSRSAVIGNVDRLGLGGRDKPSSPAKGRAHRLRPTPTPRPKPSYLGRQRASASPPALPVIEQGRVAELVGLERHCCAWPIGDSRTAEFSFWRLARRERVPLRRPS